MSESSNLQALQATPLNTFDLNESLLADFDTLTATPYPSFDIETIRPPPASVLPTEFNSDVWKETLLNLATRYRERCKLLVTLRHIFEDLTGTVHTENSKMVDYMSTFEYRNRWKRSKHAFEKLSIPQRWEDMIHTLGSSLEPRAQINKVLRTATFDTCGITNEAEIAFGNAIAAVDHLTIDEHHPILANLAGLLTADFAKPPTYRKARSLVRRSWFMINSLR